VTPDWIAAAALEDTQRIQGRQWFAFIAAEDGGQETGRRRAISAW